MPVKWRLARLLCSSLLVATLAACSGSTTVNVGQPTEVKYTYEGHQGLGTKVERKIVLEVETKHGRDNTVLNVAVKNKGEEPFILEAEDVFVSDSSGKFSTLGKDFKRVEIGPGDTGSFTIEPSQLKGGIDGNPARAEIKKRVGGSPTTVVTLRF